MKNTDAAIRMFLAQRAIVYHVPHEYTGRMKMARLHSAFILLLVITCCIAIIIPVSAANVSSSDSLTRGSRFTITITGLPNTAYYVWVTRTSTLSGLSGDQPPIIVGGQLRVQKDPPDGPYNIGSYVFSNGNGRTIRDDVAPSTPVMSNTNYYALVTTDAVGRAVVAFQTSSATATRTFSIKVENPSSAANNVLLVERGLPTGITIQPTPSYLPVLPTTTRAVETPTTSPPPATTLMTMTAAPEATPTRPSPAGIECCMVAIAAGVVVWGKGNLSR
jgi:hypothetical protein